MQQLHEENLIDRSGKDEADKVGCGQIIKDLEFHTKETKGNASLRRVITSSNWCLEITLMPWIMD